MTTHNTLKLGKNPNPSMVPLNLDVRHLAKALQDTAETSILVGDPPILPSPGQEAVIRLVEKIREVLFSGKVIHSFFPFGLTEESMIVKIEALYHLAVEQIAWSLPDSCKGQRMSCPSCLNQGHEKAAGLLEGLPHIKALLLKDIQAAFEGDPAAKSYTEIMVSYPGIFAISVYRVSHRLWELKVPLLPRMMSEYAHSLTGIDIHPGAKIGEYFFIDHGTGVVIGETTTIGDRVRIYQGVTLGALSLPRDAGTLYRDKKRHPTIEDDVIIYANATILGGETIIGKGSIIGGNVWITESVPPHTQVIIKKPDLVFMPITDQESPMGTPVL